MLLAALGALLAALGAVLAALGALLAALGALLGRSRPFLAFKLEQSRHGILKGSLSKMHVKLVFSGGFRFSKGARAGPRLSGRARAGPRRAHLGPGDARVRPSTVSCEVSGTCNG